MTDATNSRSTTTPATTDFYVNLFQQHQSHMRPIYQKLYFIFTVVPAIGYPLLFWKELGALTLLMFSILPVNGYRMYAQSTGKDPLGVFGKRFIKGDKQQLTFKLHPRKQPVTVLWEEVSQMDVRLFEVDFLLKGGQKLSVSLESLSDENLKLMKQYLGQRQTQHTA